MGKDSCPLCGALPADWVSDPHDDMREAIQIIAALRSITISPGSTVYGKDAGQWAFLAGEWLTKDRP